MRRRLTRVQPGRRIASVRKSVAWALVLSLLPSPGLPLFAQTPAAAAGPVQAAVDAAVDSFGAAARDWSAFQNPDGTVIVQSPDGRQAVRATPGAADAPPGIEIWQRDYKG